MSSSIERLSARLTTTNSSANFFALEREQLYGAFYPSIDHAAFKARLVVIVTLMGISIISTGVFSYIHFLMPRAELRPGLWLFKRIRRPSGTLIVTNLCVWSVITTLGATVPLIGYCYAHGRVYLGGAPQTWLAVWRSFTFIPIAAQGWLISFSSLQAFVLCLLDLGVRPVPIAVWNAAFVGGGLFLLSGGLIAGAFFTKYSIAAWNTVQTMLDLLARLATEQTIATAELLELNSLTLQLQTANDNYRRTATIQYCFIATLCFVIIAINGGGYLLSRLMKERISQAEHDLATRADSIIAIPLAQEEEPTVTPAKLTVRELRKLAKPSTKEGEDCWRSQRAEAVLAMKRAALDLQLVTAVVGLSATAFLGFLIYLAIYAAKGWYLTKPFAYYETAAFGIVWIFAIVNPTTTIIRCVNEWIFRNSNQPRQTTDTSHTESISFA